MKKFLKIVKILYLRKEALPELLTIIFVLGALMAVPMYYSRIDNNLLRVILALCVFVAAIVAAVMSAIRVAKRNKSSEKFGWVRFVLVILIVLILECVITSITSKYGLSSSFGKNNYYPIKEQNNKWIVAVINSLSFACFSQMILTAISSGYADTKVFLNKLRLSLVYIAIPLFVLMLLATFIVSKVFILGFILTVFLWFTALSANETINHEMKVQK